MVVHQVWAFSRMHQLLQLLECIKVQRPLALYRVQSRLECTLVIPNLPLNGLEQLF